MLGVVVNLVNLRFSNDFAVANQTDALDPFDFVLGVLHDRAVRTAGSGSGQELLRDL
ncbi:hypothetical protein [Sphingomonas sp. BK580]|uniref:hypothetical protein n=1 Tax=Sphingomonas sp. BK580 TaxID=2586972 RepID=UPI001610BCD1|nr:hypothetical protein [Sphingomonas sp. BK580]MBB3694813.1 hypothetical protein [Sphingomonas sp. BK580]